MNGKAFHSIFVQVFDHMVFDLTCRLVYIILSLQVMFTFRKIIETLGGDFFSNGSMLK